MVGQFRELPAANAVFLAWAALGGLAQVVATFLLIVSFTHRNFAVGTAYSKTEIVQVALLGLVVIGDAVSIGAVTGILVSLIGVLLLTLQVGSADGLWRALRSPAALPGLLAGTAFAVSVTAYRSAALALPGGDYLERAALTLALVTMLQAVVMGAWLAWREPGEIARVVRAFPTALGVGLVGMLASVCWFTAVTLESAAYVRAVGQVELVFAYASGVLLFGERSTPRELVGVLLIVAGVLVVLLW